MQPPPASLVDQVLEALPGGELTTPEQLLASRDPALIPVLWHLVAARRVGADSNEPLRMNSPIWKVEEHE